MNEKEFSAWWEHDAYDLIVRGDVSINYLCRIAWGNGAYKECKITDDLRSENDFLKRELALYKSALREGEDWKTTLEMRPK
jgi:hypothetical protein